MLKTYLKIALRNLYRDKIYAVISILGLSLGLACCIVLGLYLRSEFTYDLHHKNHKRIFRVACAVNIHGKISTYGVTSRILGILLHRDYPEIEAFTRFQPIAHKDIPGSGHPFYHEKDAFYWKDVFLADPNVFDVFTFQIIHGDPKTALSDASSIAVSESFAKKYFGDANPIGETVTSDTSWYKIKLVFADCPENSHMKYDILISSKRFPAGNDLSDLENILWNNRITYTFLLMPENYKAASFKEISDDFYARYMAELGKQLNSTMKFWLEPLPDIHLGSNLGYDRPTGNKLYIYGFTAVAVFILLVACMNYTNLATARSIKRAREVGMRKILGAGRPQLICQFLAESVFFTLIALIIGLALVRVLLALTPINDLIGKQQLMNYTNEPIVLMWMLTLSLLTGLISGIYPAIYLSSIQTKSALMSLKSRDKGNSRLRQTLMILQFILSISVIASTILMGIQMRYVADKPLGFNKDNKIIIRLRGADLIEKVPTMKNELLKNSHIYAVSETYLAPGQFTNPNRVEIENSNGDMETQTIRFMPVEVDFLEMMEIPIKSGRYFSNDIETDLRDALIVNEALVKKMGWEEPLGKRIWQARVIGVVKDFHHQALHQPIEPLIIGLYWNDFEDLDQIGRIVESRVLVLHVAEENLSQTVNDIRNIFLKFDPQRPFEYEFLDNILERMYMPEDRLIKLIGIYSGICIFISCMGLFGLSAFSTAQRTKEIGIRRVLGATASQIIIMLSRNTLVLVLFAAVIASLIAYFAFDEWLAGFAYRADINPIVFLLSALGALVVAFLTIALQTYKIANADPVYALRYE